MKARLISAGSVLACLLVSLHGAGVDTASSQELKAAARKQGSGITIVLKRSFIDEYADRVTMKTDFVIRRVSKIHPASEDGEVHISGEAKEAELPTVADRREFEWRRSLDSD